MSSTKKFLLLASTVLYSSQLFANPVLDNVAAGNVNINGANTAHVEVQQHSQQAILNWQSFNIPQHETVHFNQPANGIALNRVNGNNGISQIAGRLSATGRIILVNPAGIHFTPTSKVDVAGLIATTANITDKNFLRGNYKFEGEKGSNASVINEGSIKAADHGFVALLGPNVSNKGHISARLGKIAMYSTDKFILHFEGNNMIHFEVTPEDAKEAVNTGTLIADRVYASGHTAKKVLNNVIKMEKDAEARSVYRHNGKIILSAKEPGENFFNPAPVAHNVTVNMMTSATTGSSRVNAEVHGENYIERGFLNNLNETYFSTNRPAAPAIEIPRAHMILSSATSSSTAVMQDIFQPGMPAALLTAPVTAPAVNPIDENYVMVSGINPGSPRVETVMAPAVNSIDENYVMVSSINPGSPRIESVIAPAVNSIDENYVMVSGINPGSLRMGMVIAPAANSIDESYVMPPVNSDSARIEAVIAPAMNPINENYVMLSSINPDNIRMADEGFINIGSEHVIEEPVTPVSVFDDGVMINSPRLTHEVDGYINIESNAELEAAMQHGLAPVPAADVEDGEMSPRSLAYLDELDQMMQVNSAQVVQAAEQNHELQLPLVFRLDRQNRASGVSRLASSLNAPEANSSSSDLALSINAVEASPERNHSAFRFNSPDANPERLHLAFRFNSPEANPERLHSVFQFNSPEANPERLHSAFQFNSPEANPERLHSAFRFNSSESNPERLHLAFSFNSPEANPESLHLGFRFNPPVDNPEPVHLAFRFNPPEAISDGVAAAAANREVRVNPGNQEQNSLASRPRFAAAADAENPQPAVAPSRLSRQLAVGGSLLAAGYSLASDYNSEPAGTTQITTPSAHYPASPRIKNISAAAINENVPNQISSGPDAPIKIIYGDVTPKYKVTGCFKPVNDLQENDDCIIPSDRDGKIIIE
jgi:filamentous hemagglutinin family protein